MADVQTPGFRYCVEYGPSLPPIGNEVHEYVATFNVYDSGLREVEPISEEPVVRERCINGKCRSHEVGKCYTYPISDGYLVEYWEEISECGYLDYDCDYIDVLYARIYKIKNGKTEFLREVDTGNPYKVLGVLKRVASRSERLAVGHW